MAIALFSLATREEVGELFYLVQQYYGDGMDMFSTSAMQEKQSNNECIQNRRFSFLERPSIFLAGTDSPCSCARIISEGEISKWKVGDPLLGLSRPCQGSAHVLTSENPIKQAIISPARMAKHFSPVPVTRKKGGCTEIGAGACEWRAK